MNNTRWVLGLDGSYELHDYSWRDDQIPMRIIKSSDSTYYLDCPEMGYEDGEDTDSRWLLDSSTIEDAKIESEGLYEGWIRERIEHYRFRLKKLYGKTA